MTDLVEEAMNGKEILGLKMGPNDIGAVTIGEYLKSLLSELWEKEECFSGKSTYTSTHILLNLEVCRSSGRKRPTSFGGSHNHDRAPSPSALTSISTDI